jgi:predicted phage replisome organizer
MADVKWIKIVTDLFDDEKILLIEQLPEKDTIIVIWFKLLCLAGKQNNRGVFLIRDSMPYTDEMLAAVFRRPLNTVRLALKTFEEFGMVEIINGVVTVPNWSKHQNIEGMEKRQEYIRNYMRAYREEQKLLADCKHLRKHLRKQDVNTLDHSLSSSDVSVSQSSTEKGIVKGKHKHGEYKNVLLSDDDLEKLKAEFPDWAERIERLSEYIESKGAKYKNHLATIRSWARKDKNGSVNGKHDEDHGVYDERTGLTTYANGIKVRVL